MLAPSGSASRWFRKIIAATWRGARFWGECPVRRFTPGCVEKVRKVRGVAPSLFPMVPTGTRFGTFWLVSWFAGGSGGMRNRKRSVVGPLPCFWLDRILKEGLPWVFSTVCSL